MNFRKNSKRPLPPPPSFSESYGRIYARRYEGQKVWIACTQCGITCGAIDEPHKKVGLGCLTVWTFMAGFKALCDLRWQSTRGICSVKNSSLFKDVSSVTLGTYGMCAINHQDARSMQTTFRVNRGKRGNKNCENAKLHSIPNWEDLKATTRITLYSPQAAGSERS